MQAATTAFRGTSSLTLTIVDLPPGAHLLEGDFQEPLKRALCAAGRPTRVMRQNVGSVVTRNRAGKKTGRFTAGAFEGAADLSGLVASLASSTKALTPRASSR